MTAKDIPGYEGTYAVTVAGRVWSHITGRVAVRRDSRRREHSRNRT